jgi:hypothetical protein
VADHEKLRQWVAKYQKLQLILPIILIAPGLAISTYFGLRAVNSFR